MQSPPPAEATSPFMRRLGVGVKELLTKFWIWIVAIMLFVIGITGDKMTGFRIVYMGLFLVFILTFKVQYYPWKTNFSFTIIELLNHFLNLKKNKKMWLFVLAVIHGMEENVVRFLAYSHCVFNDYIGAHLYLSV